MLKKESLRASMHASYVFAQLARNAEHPLHISYKGNLQYICLGTISLCQQLRHIDIQLNCSIPVPQTLQILFLTCNSLCYVCRSEHLCTAQGCSEKQSGSALRAKSAKFNWLQVGSGRPIDDIAAVVKMRSMAWAIKGALVGVPLRAQSNFSQTIHSPYKFSKPL